MWSKMVLFFTAKFMSDFSILSILIALNEMAKTRIRHGYVNLRGFQDGAL